MSHYPRFGFESGIVSFCFSFIFFHLESHVCLSHFVFLLSLFHLGNHWDGCSSVWASKPMATVCEWFGLKTTRMVFAGLASKLMATVSSGLASKPVVMVSSGLASKPAMTDFSGLASKPVMTVFSNLASKLLATVSPGLVSKPMAGSLVEPQNQGGGGFLGLGLKTEIFGLVI
jgi:hypothetical protein